MHVIAGFLWVNLIFLVLNHTIQGLDETSASIDAPPFEAAVPNENLTRELQRGRPSSGRRGGGRGGKQTRHGWHWTGPGYHPPYGGGHYPPYGGGHYPPYNHYPYDP